MNEAIKNRYEFVLFYDVENGNPNGDPDAGNMPRIDPQTGLGIVSDVCLKRKIRNYVDMKKERSDKYDIYVTDGTVLNNLHLKAEKELIEKGEIVKDDKGKYPTGTKDIAKRYMCERYFDVRTFGAVMDTGNKEDFKCGQVRGPIQICFSKSQDKIFQQEITITRIAVTSQKEKDEGKDHMFGRKYIVPYGLYRVEGFVSANFAEHTGFTDADLELFWESLMNMFEHDHSASHGKMISRELFIFKHDCKLGNAPAHKLFELINVSRTNDEKLPPRHFSDYNIDFNEKGLPEGVSVERR